MSEDEDALTPDTDYLPDREVFDFSRAMEVVDGDMELLREIATLLLDECFQKTIQIREGIRVGDAGMVEEAAHSLKGAAGSIGAKQLEQRFLQLERVGKAGMPQESELDLAALAQEVDMFREALKEREVILED